MCKFRHSKSSVYRWYPQLVRGRFVYDKYITVEATRSRHGWVHMFITHWPTATLQLHNFSLFSTCRTSSFCTVAWQLARFQLTRRSAVPVWARGRCRISPPHFLAECCKRQLHQGSFVLLYCRLFTFSDLYCVCLSVFSCTVLLVSISQVIGCEDRLRNDLYCVEWGVKLYSNQPTHRAVPRL